MQLFDFVVVFFSNECRGGGGCGCGVVEGDGRLGERDKDGRATGDISK